MNYIAEDVSAIQARMRQIAKEETGVKDQLDYVHGENLSLAGDRIGVPRKAGESDIAYRARLKAI